jgi:recombinational DNA repair protein (RecF pathway)
MGSCAECGAEGPITGFSPRAGGAVCGNCASDALVLSADGRSGIDALLRRPLAEAQAAGLSERGTREALSVVAASYEFHGGFRLRTLSA